jgi:signal transduction histidine kinase
MPESIPDRRMIALVGLADAIARTARVGESGNLAMPRTPAQLADQIQLPRDLVAEVTAELPERLARHLRQLNLPACCDHRALARLQAEANQTMGRKLADLRRRLARTQSRASAVQAAGQVAGAHEATSCLAETLAAAAGAVANLTAAGDDTPSPGLYAIDAGAGEVFLVRGGRAETCAALSCRSGQVSHAPDSAGASALAVLNRLLLEPDSVDEDLRDAQCLHLPLMWGPRWVGGLLIPRPGNSASVEAVKLLGHLLGPMVGLTVSRDDALQLSDELAGASTALASTQDALAEQKTMRAVGEMAAGAAHELNTPLAVISGRAQLMRERAEAPGDREAWATVADQAQRISDIISDLMEFASPPAPRPEACSPQALVENAAQAFIASNHPQARVVSFDKRIGEDLPHIWVDPTQIQGVILELITNAANASPDRAGIVLDLQRDDVARCVLLRVGDAGLGMDENTLASAYTPFFSMHRAGRRRGLGLPQAKRYVENNGGKLWITSQPECGTVATVQLPIAEVSASEGDYVQAEGRYPRR